jgi:hypothetical protein
MLLAFAVLVVCLIPLIETMTTTTRGTKVTRDYLIGYNLAQMVFETVMHAATVDATTTFESLAGQLSKPDTTTAPNGCKGVSISELSSGGKPLFPADGLPQFDPATGDPDYVNLYKRYSYSLKFTPSPPGADTVVAQGGAAQLARVDVVVYWKDHQGQCTNIRFSDFISRRKF